MSITSDEVNFLVYRYLQESGKGRLRRRDTRPPRAAVRAGHREEKRGLWARPEGARGRQKGLGPSRSWGGGEVCAFLPGVSVQGRSRWNSDQSARVDVDVAL